MKKLISFLLLSMAVVGFTACQSDAPVEGPDSIGPRGEGITFMVDVDAADSGSGATLHANEMEMAEVWAVAFASDGAYKGTVQARFNKTAWEVGFDGAGKMYVLANVFGRGVKVNELVAGKNEEGFLNLVTSQPLVQGTTEGQTLLLPMISEPIEFNGNANLGTITLHRLVARLDIVNAVQGLTITKVEINNIVSKAILGEEMSSDGDIYATATYEGLSIAGNEDRPTTLSAPIYTFENTSSSQRTSVKVYYEYNGANEKTFTFPKLERHTLNSVQLVAEGVSFDWGAATWEQGEVQREVRGNAEDRQRALNAALAVSRFTQMDVFDFIDADEDYVEETVVFCEPGQNPKPLTGTDMGGTPRWNKAWATTTFIDADGNRYHVPTGNELKLFATEGDNSGAISVNWVAGREDSTSETLTDFFGVPQSGGSGESTFRCVRTGSGDSFGTNTLYGIRFKNTPQEAYYRYRYETTNGRDAMTIRVMAKDPKRARTLSEVADESFWANEKLYLSFSFPLGGSLGVAEAKYWAQDDPPGQSWESEGSYVHYYLMLRGDGMYVASRQSQEPQRIRLVMER